MGLIIHIVVFVFGAIVVVGAVAFFVTDMFRKVDYFKTKAPWLERILERRSALGVLLLVAIFLLVGDGYQLAVKEVPEVPMPPKVEIRPPVAPMIQTQQVAPRVITRTLPAPEPEKKCWISNHFGMPNSTIKRAVTATAAIIHCNYKIDVPFAVQVEFDRDFIPGAMVLPDAGMVIGGGEGKQGNLRGAG